MSNLAKIGLIFGGYTAAVVGASLAVYLQNLFNPDRLSQNSQGMTAFGDSLLFLAVLGFLSIFPTLLALFFIRPYKKIWAFFSFAALAWALTGPLAEGFNSFVEIQHLTQGWWALISCMAMIRVFGSPLFALGFFTFILFAPERRVKLTLLSAGVIESLLSLYVLIHFLIWKNFA